MKQVVAGALLDLPGVRGQVQRKQAELREAIREDLRKKSAQSEEGWSGAGAVTLLWMGGAQPAVCHAWCAVRKRSVPSCCLQFTFIAPCPRRLPAGSAPAGLRQLPRKGAASNDVKRQLLYKQNDDCRFADGDSRVSGGC